mgnify:CR=1 FL=1
MNLQWLAIDLTRLSGEDRWDTNETRLDLFFAYGLGNGWQLISNPEFVYDWEADKDHEWLVPLGGGVAKTFTTGRTPWRIAAELHKYVVSTDRLGPDWMFTLKVTPVFMDRSLKN